jgi:hypothetical protein
MQIPISLERAAEIENNMTRTPTNAGVIQKPRSFIFFFFAIVHHLYCLIMFVTL